MGLQGILTAVTLLIAVSLTVLVETQTESENQLCRGRSCYPATGNLLVGREDNLQASSTCGLYRPETYCVVGDVSETKKCFTCDSRYPWSENYRDSHNVTNIVTTFSKDRLRRWWQAENGKEEVFVQLDLDAEFHFTHLIITFKTFRPKAMYIERSFDFGKTWLPYRYFAEDCRESFPDIPMGPVKSLKEPVICEEKYSNVLPASRGEVVFKVLPPHMKIEDPYSQEVQDLLKLTNLRVVFKELHTLGDDLLDQRREINEKYYYAVYDMVVRGSCSCYGHASKCLPSNDDDRIVEHMVHSKCECTHNTKGKNCDQCADFYNDRPWQPARGKDTGECKKCECHGHATSCHFDPAVYHSRGNVSGGVCDNCMHNTDGLNCELCKSHFYQDPNRDLRDPLICQPCDCDPVGTQNNGECDMRTDPQNGLQAGRCKCKENVGGSRCERCLAGFWDFSENGCRACSCNTLGTFGNEGCNQFTGDCQCKRFVTGRNCDQCLPGYWGLSKEETGCQPCGCDIGGSFDNLCDMNTGQCNCRPGITGRACDQAIPGYFVTDLDYLRYEAEFAKGTGSTQVVIREGQQNPDYPITWTGPGFMRAYEQDTIEFTIDNIPYSMSYEIIIRYETQMPESWEDVRVNIIRPDVPDPDGRCGNGIPQDDYLSTTLSRADRYIIVSPAICFEKGKTYRVILDFQHYQTPDNTPDANILIDSIALIPVYQEVPVRVDTTPMPSGELTYCNNLEYDASRLDDIPDRCKKFMFSIGAAIQNRSLECDCDPTGSESSICDPYGGQCKCKPNVVGRRCDICMPGSYGFSPQGCQLCNCNAQGSRDNLCEPVTGQCLCQSYIDGRACDTCESGMYNFPNCQRCQCNGHADICEDRTGNCINCEDYTTGPRCDLCLDGYYGDPSLGSGIPCRECMCPGGRGSGYQHADECILDPFTKKMLCDCPPEFAGDMCERCAENHFGNPLVVNGTCTSCLEGCNYNIDMLIPGSCDPFEGKCLKCQYNTAGDNCELCASGYYGDATMHSCIECLCHPLGTARDANDTVLPCDQTTGQCPCLPNVIGANCDMCAADHWKLASGTGCETCDCDEEGSLSPQCNEFDGQCPCVEGRGGRKCDQCIELQYGDPRTECFPCDCNPDGSEFLQCDPQTGQCPCLPGITGMKCDRCDRGTTGDLPNCVPCGECFDNWDEILRDLRNATDEMLSRVNVTKSEGAVGVYDEQFIEMERKLQEIQDIINRFNQSAADMSRMETDFSELRQVLGQALNDLEALSLNFKTTNQQIAQTDNNVSVLQAQMNNLLRSAEQAKKAVEDLIQADINGAYNTIKANAQRSRNALGQANEAESLLEEAANLQRDTRKYLEDNTEEFEKEYQNNANTLGVLEEEKDAIVSAVLNDANQQVCDAKSELTPESPCDPTCGGGGCSRCGDGESCTYGAQGKATAADLFTQKAQNQTKIKSATAKVELDKLNKALKKSNSTVQAAIDARDTAKSVLADATNATIDLSKSLEKIANFLNEDKATPEQVRTLAERVLEKSIPMNPENISELARQINQTIQNLTNIEQILNETAADLATSEALKQRADNASKAAAAILQMVNDLNKKLSDARAAQNDSQEAVDKAQADIAATRDKLKQIGDEMTKAVKTAQELKAFGPQLKDRASQLSKKNTENQHKVELVVNQANVAKKSSQEAEETAKAIRKSYDGISIQVSQKYNDSFAANTRAEELLKRAGELAKKLSTKYISLTSMDNELAENGQILEDLQKQIDMLTKQVNGHLEKLTSLENFHSKCEATESTP